MNPDFPVLRRVTLAVLGLAFTFGIGTLWIRAQWPFALFQSVVLALACAWFGTAAWRGHRLLNAWLALPFGITALAGFQIAFGQTESVWHTRQTGLEWITHAAVAVLAFQVFRDRQLRLASLRFLAVGGGALALLSTLQNYSAPGRVLWLFDSGYQELVFGPFTYHTKLANFAELCIPVACWLAITDIRYRVLYITAAAALAGSVVASASRGGLLVLTLEMLVLAALALRRNRTTWRSVIAVGAAVLCGIAVFGWDVMQERLANKTATNDLRLPLMATSLDMSARYWLAGSGLGTWPVVYPEFARFDAHLRMNQAHCDWLQWLVEGGIVLPVCILLMAAAAIRSARQECWMIGVVFVWLHGAIDYPMQQTPALASLVMALWGAGLAAIPFFAVGGSDEA